MTDIDTATIRAEYEDGADVLWVDVLALCDALDAARAERDGWRTSQTHYKELFSDMAARAEEAEARIAAALAVVTAWDEWDREPVRRALIEGTGQ